MRVGEQITKTAEDIKERSKKLLLIVFFKNVGIAVVIFIKAVTVCFK